ncbi:MAG: hypothetical protein HC888_10825 [Candidatus Competibacteraceae bacterium]|nr:hypothetical protein [Candidatus Competibacteraceae bacterium]
MAHLRKLSPDDEVLRICEAMGVLALLARQVPGELATEREKWSVTFWKMRDEESKRTGKYLEDLERWTIAVEKTCAELKATAEAVRETGAAVEASILSAPNRLDMREMERKIDERMEELALRPLQKAIEKCHAATKALEDAGHTAAHRVVRWHDFNQQAVWDQAIMWAAICYAVSMVVTISLLVHWLRPFA